ncbi:cyclin-like protein [Annulohypoxylon truncatum]|uniref:cyclin-like protein n=1 Tax=Annulohypoxylon truncatum TaxID=327061 RepID=UPI002007B3F1|nr:cyclin-like protein [Annulohypoxylon truncatum]KAI1210824.1 cyclin-like protein [Annulohypoxylon truncatum]
MAHMTNPLATPDQLYQRTSFSALPSDLQDIIFFATQVLTQAAGVLLRIPQSVAAQAGVILARYWLIASPLSHEFSDVSAAALFLVAKLSAHPCPPRDVCNVYAYLLSAASPLFRGQNNSSSNQNNNSTPNNAKDTDKDPSSYYLSESAYAAFRSRILSLEARILYSLSFDTHVALPHPLAVTYLQALDFLSAAPKTRIAARSVAYLNTALLSPQLLYLTHQPNALAVAAVYAAARDVGAKIPECAWWEVFDVDREELGFLVVGMRSLEGWVRRQREDYEELGQGMVTRAFVEGEMRKRGLRIGNGSGGGVVEGGEMEDEETAMMRSLDEKAAQLEE